MKKLSILVVVLAVIAAALPFGFGWYTEGHIRHQLEQVQSPFLKMTIAKYDRGWLTSDATVEFAFSDQYKEMLAASSGGDDANDAALAALDSLSKLTYSMDFEIGHGPVLRQKEFALGLSESIVRIDSGEEIAEFLQKTGAPYLFQAYSRTDFSGLSHMTADMPQMALAEDGQSFGFSGMDLVGTYDPNTREVTTTGKMAGLTVDSKEAKLSVSDITFDGALTMLGGLFYLGESSGSVGKIDILPSDPNEPRMAFEGLKIATSVTQSHETSPLDVGVQYFIKKIAANQFSLDDFVMDLKIKNLDREFLEQYYAMTQDIATMQVAADPDVLGKFQDLIYKFVTASPSLTVQPLSFRMNDGPVKVTLDVTTDGSKITSVDQVSIANLQSLREIVDATAAVEVGKDMALDTAKSRIKAQMRTAMIAQGQDPSPEQLEQIANQQAPMMIASLVAQGLVEETDTTYRAAATVEKGVVKVNGKTMPF